ncbi:hypothetical protein COLO4_01366 [Corchorus olitorius]|uniref:Uncharacterized protein n=1 Tax=Corchorus olitorius TaxID=93759 RepID=A0A1R3L2J9_9ROSI|nr:hypothetical protein COLO4_01366 [Corchorus olitorius]
MPAGEHLPARRIDLTAHDRTRIQIAGRPGLQPHSADCRGTGRPGDAAVAVSEAGAIARPRHAHVPEINHLD